VNRAARWNDVDERSGGDDRLTLFSMVFGVPHASRARWFDPVLVRDNPVWVDPFLLDLCTEPEFEGASVQVFDHFRVLFDLLAKDPKARIEPLLRFPEFSENCLGYTASGVDGAGSGWDRAQAMRSAIGNAIKAGLSSPKHFEEISLLAPHIGRDLISDITCRILAARFMDYTARIARGLRLPTEPTRLDSFGVAGDAIVPTAHEADLPRNPHSKRRRAIVLTPKVLLRKLPTINKDSFEDFLYDVHMDELRERFNVQVKKDLASRVLQIANENPVWVREYTEYEDSRTPTPYDFARDPESVGTSYRRFYEVGLSSPSGVVVPTTARQVLQFVQLITAVFRRHVEQNAGYVDLYEDKECTKPKDEKAVQRMYSAIASGMCQLANVRMAKETNAGAGPVDFLFTTGYQSTVLTETKLISNGSFWNGIGGQLPKYLRGHDADTGLIVGVAFTDDEVKSVRYAALTDFARDVGAELGYTIEGERIDARPKRTPPSKLKSVVAPPRRPKRA
jgi:hypothetical protein